MFDLSLNGAWKLRKVKDAEWIDGNVPGSVFNDLLAAGKINDPFYRDNEEQAKIIASHDYEYIRDFEADACLIKNERVILCCEGLDTLAEITVNGVAVANTNNMHRIYEFDIKNLLNIGKNNIKVVLYSPVEFINKKHAENPLWGASDAMAGFPHIRKAHCMFGWDWGPQIPDSGIWRNISIKGFNSARIDDVYITQKHHNGMVDLDVRVRVDNWSKKALLIKVKVSAPDGSITESHIKTSDNENHIELHIDKPELWWPNGFGNHPLYRVDAELLDGLDMLDRQQFNIGLRTMKVRREKDKWGESFEFEVNGVSIFAMGADYIPEDNLLPRCSPQLTEKLIKNCIAANFNSIRVWGGGNYPEDYFFDLCDSYGLIVWQDLMFACAVYDMTEEFSKNIAQEAADNMKRLRHHASLGLWCGNNEMEMGWVDWPFPKTAKLRTDYIKQFEILLAQVAKETDPNTFYWPSSPSSGGGFDNPNNENIGDVHYWDVWHGLKPFTDYRKFHFRFASEFGFQSFPSVKTVATFTLPEDRNIFSRIMENHQKNGTANGKILYYLSENFKYPKDFESLLYTSQILQAEAIKYGVEHWRRNRGRCMGAIYWQLNDCWPVASWASIDYFGRWKALHYFAKRFFAPVLLSACDNGTSVSLHITNETMKPFKGVARWKLRDNISAILKEGSAAVEVNPLSAIECCDLNFEKELCDKNLLRKTYLEFSLFADGEYVSDGTVLFVKAKHFEFLDPQLTVQVDDAGDMFIIKVRSEAYAKYVELDLTDADCIYDNNYFDISAGDVKMVEVSKDSLSKALTLEQIKGMLKVKSIYDIA